MVPSSKIAIFFALSSLTAKMMPAGPWKSSRAHSRLTVFSARSVTFGIAAAGRDQDEVDPVEDLGDRDAGAAGDAPDRAHHRRIGRHLLAGGDADLRIALVVGVHHLDLLAEHAALRVPLVDGELHGVRHLLALLGERAGERRTGRDLDHLLGQGAGRAPPCNHRQGRHRAQDGTPNDALDEHCCVPHLTCRRIRCQQDNAIDPAALLASRWAHRRGQ